MSAVLEGEGADWIRAMGKVGLDPGSVLRWLCATKPADKKSVTVYFALKMKQFRDTYFAWALID